MLRNILKPSVFLWVIVVTLGFLTGCGPGGLFSTGGGGSSRRDQGDGSNPPDQANEKGNGPQTPNGNGSSNPQNPGGKGTPVLAFFGGYTSCGQADDGSPDPNDQGMTEVLEEAVSEVEAAGTKDPLTILSCYSTDSTRVHYVLSSKPNSVKTVPVKDLAGEIASAVAKVANGRLHLVGHSYGGWTVLNLADKLDGSVKLGSLVTIDPISVKECSPDVFLGGVFGGGGEACRRAPKDFSGDQLAAIKKRAGTWVNYYQTDATVLHSSPMTGAENIKRDYPSDGLAAHTEFLSDDDVIQKIAKVVSSGAP